MKSYCSSPKKFSEYALEAEKYGSDLVYIVDSAGGMFPGEVKQYIEAVRDKSSTLRLGFHGHNNLGMGVANALKAVECGVEIVDTSLQGIGRSAGNTSTEQFLCALIRHNINLNIDPIKVMDISEQYILPLVKNFGLDSEAIISGLALFHSDYMHLINNSAIKYGVDPRQLILEVSDKEKINVSASLVDRSAKNLASR